MARISTYQLDEKVTGGDKWIGSDSGFYNKTKNFTPLKLADYFNSSEKIDSTNSLRFWYQTLDFQEDRSFGTISFENEIGASVSFSSITSFLLSKRTEGNIFVYDFLSSLIDSKVLLHQGNTMNLYAIYEVTNIEEYELDSNFIKVDVSFIRGNGSLIEDLSYLLSVVDFALEASLNWGNIEGNLSDQTDLQEALDLKADISSLGAVAFSNDYNDLDNLPEIPVPTLENVLAESNETNGYNIAISDGDEITFDNGSRIRKGLTDSGNGGAKGVALVCSLDYELKWEAGRLYVMEQNGFTIREVSHNFTITPTATDDDTKGFVIGSRWILDNGDIYLCTDATEANAVWELQTIDLSTLVPYTGATQDVDLGEFELKAGQIEFDTTPTGTAGVGVMRWNDSDGTLDLGLKGGNVTLQLGQEQLVRAVNKTATNITLLESDYQAVRVTGAQGQRLKVDLAQATNDLLSAETIGLVTETIANNQEGFITISGLVRNINTTGSLQGETWADGDILYLSPTTAGRITNIKPTAPNHLVVIGYVVYAHANNGKIFVKVDNGYELEELHNVTSTNYTTPIDSDSVLTYDVTNSLWKRLTLANLKTELTNIRRNAQSSNINYCGYAPSGSLENQAVWTITKITVATNGSVTTTTSNNVTWTSVPF